ncbi:MAG: hypothetical protein ABI999_13365 [Acidobacteriota bacterium]
MTYRAKKYFSILTYGVVLMSVSMELRNSAFGQSIVPNGSSGPFAESLERRYRETALRTVGMTKRGLPPDARISQAATKRLNDDFSRVQIIRLDMVHDITTGRRFEYNRLFKDAAEIKKLVTRMRSVLDLSPNEQKDGQRFEAVEFDREKIQDAASNLCIEISGFIENPMVRSGVYNARSAAEAARSLDTVINLANNIKNSARTLQRSK